MSRDGCIIIGYQGIGKSSTVKENPGLYIDFESSNFKDDEGNRPDDWYIYYCNAAWDLAKQGYRVFTASHEVVRARFAELAYAEEDEKGYVENEILVVHPTNEIKDEWIERLQNRYDTDPSHKNEAALGNAKDRYLENQKELSDDCALYGFSDVLIDNTNYKLHDVIEGYFAEYVR